MRAESTPAPTPLAAPRRLRVLHFVSGGFSGATQVAIDLCGDDEHQESLLVLRRRGMDPTERIAQLRQQGLDVRLVSRWLHAYTVWQVARICRQWRPDVLVAHGFSEHLWGRYAGWLAQVPVLVHVEHNTRERYTAWRLRQSLWLAKRSARLVGVSEAVRDALVRLGHPPEKCIAILNGIDLERWSRGLPWAERETAVVMPARFARQKDHATLIRAAALLRQRGHALPIYLAGEGKASWRREAQALCQQLGVADQVHILGHVPDLPALMGRVKFCVLATHYEGLGLGLIEGMASGCCGVGSDVEGVREIIAHGVNGLLTAHADPEALASALQTLLADDDQARRLAEAGTQHVRQTFDKRTMRRQYQDLFAALRSAV